VQPYQKGPGSTGGWQAGHVLLQTRKPTVSWAAPKAVWSAGRGSDPAPLLCAGEASEETALGRYESGLLISKGGGYRKEGDRLFSRIYSVRTRGNVF